MSTKIVATFATLLAVMTALGTTRGANAAEPNGTWLTKDRDARVAIAPCGSALCGRVVWLKDATDPTTRAPMTDKFNRDPSQRNRPLMGVQILSDMKPAGTPAKWSGRLYHPESGKTYSSNMKLISPDALVVEGCVSFYCQAETWTRAN
jgi:uncharacterized protein (DUF2147 family)